jgi:hypothetical protein
MGKSFNIILNSNDTDSFIGGIHNAKYFINFGNIIEPEEFNKHYSVSIKFLSKHCDTLPVDDSIFLLHLNFSNRARIQQYQKNSSIFAILNRQVETSTVLADTSDYPFIFTVGHNDNPPVYLDNLHDIAQVNLKITYEDMTTIFTEMPDYVAILYFQQL